MYSTRFEPVGSSEPGGYPKKMVNFRGQNMVIATIDFWGSHFHTKPGVYSGVFWIYLDTVRLYPGCYEASGALSC